jgi:hypothetical protein
MYELLRGVAACGAVPFTDVAIAGKAYCLSSNISSYSVPLFQHSSQSQYWRKKNSMNSISPERQTQKISCCSFASHIPVASDLHIHVCTV